MDGSFLIVPPLKKQRKDRGQGRKVIGQEIGRCLQRVCIRGRFGEPKELGRTEGMQPNSVSHTTTQWLWLSPSFHAPTPHHIHGLLLVTRWSCGRTSFYTACLSSVGFPKQPCRRQVSMPKQGTRYYLLTTRRCIGEWVNGVNLFTLCHTPLLPVYLLS